MGSNSDYVEAICIFTPQKICQKGHHVFCRVWSRILLLKNCIALILMQKCNKLLNNITVYLCSNSCLEKELVPLPIVTHDALNNNFLGDTETWFKKHEVSPNSK